MNSYELLDDVPSLSLSVQDIRVLATITASYLLFVRREQPFRQHDAEMVLLEGLLKRMQAMPAEGGAVPMTTQEIRALANALQGFANAARQMLPASAQREEMLKPIVAIRQHLLRMLVGRNN